MPPILMRLPGAANVDVFFSIMNWYKVAHNKHAASRTDRWKVGQTLPV